MNLLVSWEKRGRSVRKSSDLLEMSPKSVSDNAKRDKVPYRVATIATLLAELNIQGIPNESVFSRLDLNKKKPRRCDEFGSDRQQQR